MSFNALVSGADCGPVNALSQMVKHTEADRSLQLDRIGSSGSGSRLQQLPSTSMHQPNAADVAMARQFFDGAGPSSSMQHVAPFQLPSPAAMAPGIRAGLMPSSSPKLDDAWARGGTADPLREAWSASGSASASQSHTPVPTLEQQRALTQSAMANVSMGLPMQSRFGSGMMMSGYPTPMMMMNQGRPQQQINWDQEFTRIAEQDVKGKGKMVDDLEEAFRQLSAEDQKASAEKPQSRHPDYMSDFERVWDELQKGPARLNDEDYAKWESDYQQILQAQREELEGISENGVDFDYTADLNAQWEQRYGRGLTSDMTEQPVEAGGRQLFDDEGRPTLLEYPFSPNNPNLALPAATLLDTAKEYLANNGSLSEAALMLEAAIQKGELGEGGYEAWILLGETRSMDEREEIGLIALQRGVDIAKKAGARGPGMLSLAVSYTNEGFELAANSVLRDWLLSKYPTAKIGPYNPNAVAAWHSREVVREAYLNVAQMLHSRGESDPDVQVGLGILYYTDQLYDKAKDCFEAALWARPNDYLLWNRLGSCLSNGSKPEEALNVYREALRLRPTYTRAIFNVGVACLNIGAYKEAAEHFLSALASQKTSSDGAPSAEGEVKSEQLWKTLRKAFSLMDRPDLVDLANKTDVELFRGQGLDF